MSEQQPQLKTLSGTLTGSQVHIVIVGDGYTAAELPRFHADADAAAKTIARTPPFDRMALFIARVDAVSNESTAYRSTAGLPVDSQFHARFKNNHLLVVDENQVLEVVEHAAAGRCQSYKIVVLVNAPERFGGGGAFYARTSPAASGLAVASNANGNGTLIHEMGHAFGLSDEYRGSSKMRGAPNVSGNIRNLPAFWKARLTPRVELPTTNPDRKTVGAFPTQLDPPRYRPQYSCIMKTASPFDSFCKICADWIEASH